MKTTQDPRIGKPGSAAVTWHNGHTTIVSGTVTAIVGDEVFLDSVWGPVAGQLDTLEMEDDDR